MDFISKAITISLYKSQVPYREACKSADGRGKRGWWRAKGGFIHKLEQKSSHCVLMEIQNAWEFVRPRRLLEAVLHRVYLV